MQNNTYFDGGGIYCEASSATIVDNEFLENGVVQITADGTNGRGAGIGVFSSEVAIIGNAFLGNQFASYGGAIHVAEGTAEIRDNQFIGNRASEGGALDLAFDSVVTVENDLFVLNEALGYSGFSVRSAVMAARCSSARQASTSRA